MSDFPPEAPFLPQLASPVNGVSPDGNRAKAGSMWPGSPRDPRVRPNKSTPGMRSLGTKVGSSTALKQATGLTPNALQRLSSAAEAPRGRRQSLVNGVGGHGAPSPGGRDSVGRIDRRTSASNSRASSREGETGGAAATSPRAAERAASGGGAGGGGLDLSPPLRRSSTYTYGATNIGPCDALSHRPTPPPPSHRADFLQTGGAPAASPVHPGRSSPPLPQQLGVHVQQHQSPPLQHLSPHSPREGADAFGDAEPPDQQQQQQQQQLLQPPPPSQQQPPAPPRPRVPAGVQNAYVISSMLGAGAFGTVWMATARESGAGVAIKIVERKRQIHEDFSLEPAEVEILKCIHHPNIVELIDLVTTEASVYLIMELVMGGHLQDRLKAHGPYREVHARSLIGQVVGAVRHLHDQNIIHRDIKPENILFAEPEEAASDDGTPRTEVVKLTDFGLSTMKEGRLTTRCGTPSYCAPELLSGEGYGKAVDIWSLGVLTYVVLTGVQPFVGTDRQDLFRRIQKGQYTYPGERTDHGGAGARRGSCGPAPPAPVAAAASAAVAVVATTRLACLSLRRT